MQLRPSRRCPALSSVWLYIVNFLFFLTGLLFIGLSSWGISAQKEDPVTAVLPAGGLITLVIVGVALVVVSIIGCLGTKFNYNCCGRVTLIVYALVMLILMIMEWAAGGALITFTGKLDSFESIASIRESSLNSFINGSYNQCCCNLVRCPNDTCWLPAALPFSCDSPVAFATYLGEYVTARVEPVGIIAILIGFVQLFTAIVALCSYRTGRKDEAARNLPRNADTFSGTYSEGDEAYPNYGYEAYVKPAGKEAPGATAPKAPAAAKPAPAPKKK